MATKIHCFCFIADKKVRGADLVDNEIFPPGHELAIRISGIIGERLNILYI